MFPLACVWQQYAAFSCLQGYTDNAQPCLLCICLSWSVLLDPLYCLQQQSLKKAAEVAAAEVVQDAQDYVAAESAALLSKQVQGQPMGLLAAQGELCSYLVFSRAWRRNLTLLPPSYSLPCNRCYVIWFVPDVQ